MNRKRQKKRTKQEQKKRIVQFVAVWSILAVIGFVWVICSLFELVSLLYDRKQESETVTGGNIQTEAGGEAESFVGSLAEPLDGGDENTFGFSAENAGIDRERCQKLYEEYAELLILVNREHELTVDLYEASLRNICEGRLQASDFLYEDLVDLLAAAREDGYQYWIASAYRSRERQQELVDEDVESFMAKGMSYSEALAKTYEQTMPAGYSEHETGLALDLLCSENVNMDISQADEPGNQWLAAHAHEYGFILRYPEDKEEITDIYYEPWHFRYVGKETAQFLWENDLTLEEFYEYLEK